MADNHIKAEKDYIRGMKYKDIAEKYDVSINTVKSWKRRYEWTREKGAHKQKGVHTKKRGAPIGSKNALGNRGGAAPKKNSNSVTHGFFRKYLPQQAMGIIEDMDENGLNTLDMLWMSIQTKFAAIMHSQQVMFVESKDEMIKELKKEKRYMDENSESEETEWEFQFAWDRQATFLNAQSRAMGELRSLIKQFDEMAHANDERRLKLEQMNLGIEKTKAEIKKLQGDGEKEDVEDWVSALKDVAAKRRKVQVTPNEQ